MSSTPPAHPAATVLLLRDGQDGPEVFMVVRHQSLAGFGGACVFPGGRVDEADHRLAASHHDFGLPPDSLPFRIAAIRETFEEAGVLLARPEGSDQLIAGARLTALADTRKAVHASADEFAALIARERLHLALDLLIPYAHWITPVVRPKRYDTHFFVLAAPDDHMPDHDGAESVGSLWITPRQMLAEAKAGKMRVEFATRMNLRPLLDAGSVEAALADARTRRIVTVLPEVSSDEIARLPLEAGYGAEYFPTRLVLE